MEIEKDLLNISVSTVASNLAFLLKKISNYSDRLPGSIKFTVISQFEKEYKSYSLNGIDVYLTKDKGLSKSRNLAIEKCRSEWIWFQDDDIDLLLERLPDLLKSLKEYDGELKLVKIGSLEDSSVFFKNYDRYKTNRVALSLRVSSIEMIVKTRFLKERRIFFDENLGLGTDLPSCEENLFFYDCAVRNRARYSLYSYSVCLHTTLIESRNIDQEGRYKARGYLLRRMKNILTPLVFIWWGGRNTNDGIKRLARLRLMLKGYFNPDSLI